MGIPVSSRFPRRAARLGSSRRWTVKEGELSHRAPQILPGGKTVLFTVFTGQELAPSNRVLSLVTGQTRTLVESASWARYVPDGHLIYVLNGVAVTAPFDPNRLTVTGPPTPVLEDLRQSLAAGANLWPFAVSAEGSLVFVPGGPGRRSLVSVDRHGVGTPLGSGLHAYQQLRLSPDGQRLALTIREPVRLRHLDLRVGARPADPADDRRKQWLPGLESGWHTHRVRVRAIRATTTCSCRPPMAAAPPSGWLTSDKVQRPSSWSPDGRILSFTQDDPMPDLWTLSFEQPPTTRPMVQMPGYQTSSRISPDGRWLAYASEESGQFEVYVTSFPDGARKSPVSSGGGSQPVWAKSGRELFYFNGDKLMVVDVNTGQPSVQANRRCSSKCDPLSRRPVHSYDVSLDGQRFVMIQRRRRRGGASGQRRARLVQ